MGSNLACHSAGLSVRDILTDIELDSPAGHLAKSKHRCLLRSFLPQISIRNPGLRIPQQKTKSQKHDPGVGEDNGGDQTTRRRALLLSFAFLFPHQTAANTVRLILLFAFLEGWIWARGEVIRDWWWWLLTARKWGMLCSYISKEMILRTFPDTLIDLAEVIALVASSCLVLSSASA